MAEYRVSATTFGRLMSAMLLGALTIVVTVLSDGDLPGSYKIGILIAGLGGVGAVVAWARVARTSTDVDGVTVRGLLRTRTYAWPDIQAIQIEQNPGGYADDRGPRQIGVLYDGTGRRIPLPQVNEKNLERLGLALGAEIAAMRAAWVQGRGPGWAPVPAVQRKIEERVRYGFTSLAMGVFIAMLATPVAVVLFAVGLFTHADTLPAPLSWLFHPASILVLPAAVFPLAAVVSKLTRRHAR
jgi:hypothetical protein